MSYIRAKKSGNRTYYYEVEGYRDNRGKVRQRVIRYLGKYPFIREFPVEPKLAGQLAQALMASDISEQEVRELLEKLGIPVPPGTLNEVSLVYNPPLGKLVIRIS